MSDAQQHCFHLIFGSMNSGMLVHFGCQLDWLYNQKQHVSRQVCDGMPYKAYLRGKDPYSEWVVPPGIGSDVRRFKGKAFAFSCLAILINYYQLDTFKSHLEGGISTEGIVRTDVTIDMSVGNCLDCLLIDVGGPRPSWAVPPLHR